MLHSAWDNATRNECWRGKINYRWICSLGGRVSPRPNFRMDFKCQWMVRKALEYKRLVYNHIQFIPGFFSIMRDHLILQKMEHVKTYLFIRYIFHYETNHLEQFSSWETGRFSVVGPWYPFADCAIPRHKRFLLQRTYWNLSSVHLGVFYTGRKVVV